MKRFIFLTALIISGGHVFAQDIITKKDATEIQAKVVKVSTYEIEYKQWNNPDGPIYTIPVKDVFTIKYENGQREVLSQIEDTQPSNTARWRNANGRHYPHYEGEVAIGYSFDATFNYDNPIMDYAVFETVHGVRIIPYLFSGVGTGLHIFPWTKIRNRNNSASLYDKYYGAMMLPVFFNVKGYYPSSDKFAVYLSADFGGVFGIYKWSGSHFYTSVGPGIQVGRKAAFDFSIRYQYTGGDALLARLGVRF